MGESPSEDETESDSDANSSGSDSGDNRETNDPDDIVDSEQAAGVESESAVKSEPESGDDFDEEESDDNEQESTTSDDYDGGDWVWADVEKTGRQSQPKKTESQPSAADKSLVSRFRTTQAGPLMWLREMLSSAVIVLAIGLLLFGISGVWPPMVAVQSGSMDPNMQKGDLVLVTDPGRFSPGMADNAGVITQKAGEEGGYRSFGNAGSVVVFDDPGGGPPTIHRVHLSVQKGENWHARAESDYLRGDTCEEIANCPAPHDGYLTKGDNNPRYDQVSGIAPPVRESWITGVARLRVPYLGWIRLVVTGAASLVPMSPTVTLLAGGTSAGVTLIRARENARYHS